MAVSNHNTTSTSVGFASRIVLVLLFFGSGVACSDDTENTNDSISGNVDVEIQKPLGGTFVVNNVVLLAGDLKGSEITVFGYLIASKSGEFTSYRLVSDRGFMSRSIGDSINSVSLRLALRNLDKGSQPNGCIGDFVRVNGELDLVSGEPVLSIGEHGFVISHNGDTSRQCTK